MSATCEQIQFMLDFLAEHTDLARGRIRSIEARVQSQRLWEEMCNALNSMGGCHKTVKQWQKVWYDKKYITKKSVAAARRSAATTGGGPSSAPQVTSTELKILSIMGDGFGEPQTSASVPAFVEEQAVNVEVEPEASAQPISMQVDLTPASHSQLSHTTRSVLPTQRSSRNRHSISDVRNRVFRLEEQRVVLEQERNGELAAIRVAIEELCRLVAQHITQRQDLNTL